MTRPIRHIIFGAAATSICECFDPTKHGEYWTPFGSDSARLADLEALREVTEQLVVAADPYRRQFLAEKAETILRRLREPERVAS